MFTPVKVSGESSKDLAGNVLELEMLELKQVTSVHNDINLSSCQEIQDIVDYYDQEITALKKKLQQAVTDNREKENSLKLKDKRIQELSDIPSKMSIEDVYQWMVKQKGLEGISKSTLMKEIVVSITTYNNQNQPQHRGQILWRRASNKRVSPVYTQAV